MTTQAAPAYNRARVAQFAARYGIVLVLAVMVAALTVLSPIIRGEQYFLRPNNLVQVLLQASINMIIAVGMTYVITSGGIDLSVGSMVALSVVLSALFMRDIAPAFAPIAAQLGMDELTASRLIAIGGFLVAVIVCGLCGLFNGVLIALFGLPPFIATLGTLGMFRGLAMIISDGRPVYGFGREFLQMFSRAIPTPFLLSLKPI